MQQTAYRYRERLGGRYKPCSCRGLRVWRGVFPYTHTYTRSASFSPRQDAIQKAIRLVFTTMGAIETRETVPRTKDPGCRCQARRVLPPRPAICGTHLRIQRGGAVPSHPSPAARRAPISSTPRACKAAPLLAHPASSVPVPVPVSRILRAPLSVVARCYVSAERSVCVGVARVVPHASRAELEAADGGGGVGVIGEGAGEGEWLHDVKSSRCWL